MNVLWVVMDAVRYDHLSCYGYERPTTPIVDGIAERGVRFREVITPGARTWESFCSFLSGLFPQHHGVRHIGGPALSPRICVLPEILREQGFRTFARTVDLSMVGLGRGFEDFDPEWKKRQSGIHRFRTINNLLRRWSPEGLKPGDNARADLTNTNESSRWIQQYKDKQWFVFVRYVTAHWPYWPLAPFDGTFHSASMLDHSFNDYSRRESIVSGQGLSVNDIQHAVSHYDAAIHFIDSQIAHLVETLKSTGLYDETLIIIMSDHGEGLGEHGYFFEHGDHVYEHLIRVPMILSGPKVPQGRVVTAPVQTIDLMPTILELLGLDNPQGIDGRSLVPLMGGNGSGRTHTFSESGREFHSHSKRYLDGIAGAIRTVRRHDGWKLVYIPRHVKHEFQLYYLPDDPGENRDIVSQNPLICDELGKELRAWLEDQTQVFPLHSESEDVDPEVTERLRQLGYIE